VIVRFTVGLPVAFEEIPGAQFLGAMGAGEVLRMPGLAQGGDHLPHDGFVAGAAASLLAGVDSLPTHVRLQVPEHRIEVLLGGRRALRLGGFGGARVLRIGDRLVLGVALVDLRTDQIRTLLLVVQR
jgi:hypothetical protein